MSTDAAAVRRPLNQVIETLRSRGLELRRGSEPPAPERAGATARPALPTGHAALNAALHGGWPAGGLALLDAPAGSGATSLALGSLAACQARGGVVAYLDPGGALDPAVADRLGVRLEWLLVVRPADAAEAVEIAGWLARDGRIDALVLDLADITAAPRGLDRLAGLLVRSGTVTLLLGGGAGARGAAGVRVALRRRAWWAVERDLVGQRVEALVERHRWGLAGGRAELDLWFAEGRRVDPLLRAAATVREVEAGVERPALRVVGA